MLDENTGAEATISDEELELDLTLDGTEDAEALTEKLEKAEKAKKQILARAKKAEEELKALKVTPPTQKEEKKIIKEDSQVSDEKLWEIAEMIQEGYTRADADFISKNGGRDALKDPNSYVSIALKSIKEQRAAEIAASQTGNQSNATEVERKYTEEQLKNMPLSKLKEILPHADN